MGDPLNISSKKIGIRYLSKYIEITDELENILTDNLLIKEFPKGTLLLESGDLCNECYFILKGLVRSFCLKDSDEVTIDFFMEEQVISPSCYGEGRPSTYSLECLEHTIAFVGTPNMEREMYSKYPQLESLSRIIGDKMMSSFKDNFSQYKLASPEERYLNLVKTNPQLIQRAPQYQIATYLGMKPESLSRIRKRIVNSKLS